MSYKEEKRPTNQDKGKLRTSIDMDLPTHSGPQGRQLERKLGVTAELAEEGQGKERFLSSTINVELPLELTTREQRTKPKIQIADSDPLPIDLNSLIPIRVSYACTCTSEEFTCDEDFCSANLTLTANPGIPV